MRRNQTYDFTEARGTAFGMPGKSIESHDHIIQVIQVISRDNECLNGSRPSIRHADGCVFRLEVLGSNGSLVTSEM